jgi:HEAT repeat protein
MWQMRSQFIRISTTFLAYSLAAGIYAAAPSPSTTPAVPATIPATPGTIPASPETKPVEPAVDPAVAAAIDALARQLADADWRKRESAVAELIRMGDAAGPALERLVTSTTSDEVRTAAHTALRQIGDKPDRRPFVRHAPSEGRPGPPGV